MAGNNKMTKQGEILDPSPPEKEIKGYDDKQQAEKKVGKLCQQGVKSIHESMQANKINQNCKTLSATKNNCLLFHVKPGFSSNREINRNSSVMIAYLQFSYEIVDF